MPSFSPSSSIVTRQQMYKPLTLLTGGEGRMCFIFYLSDSSRTLAYQRYVHFSICRSLGEMCQFVDDVYLSADGMCYFVDMY